MSQNLLLTEEQKELFEMIRDFAENEVKPVVAECDANDTLPMDVYAKAFEMGLAAE